MKNGFKVVGIVIALLVVIFLTAYFGLGMKRFFGPRHENVRREIFENTKSYSHGKTQDLARYYEQYSNAKSEENRQAVVELIKMQFADFDVSVIRSTRLRNFLTNTRGY